jgi:hypothetical protein
MQPYFLPYLGYFQLISAVDTFIVYDNIQYTKKGWINRNRMLRNGEAVLFTLPLQKASDFSHVRDRNLAAGFVPDELLNKFTGAYRRAPNFSSVFPMLEDILGHEDTNLFRFLHRSISKLCLYLRITTPIRISSDIAVNHDLTKQEKILAVCRATRATTYVNAIGGVDLYSPADFRASEIDLKFLASKPCEYAQFGHSFVPSLSIVDVLMFNSAETVRAWVSDGYQLI